MSLIFLSGTPKAQSFAPVGAIWHYNQATIIPNVITYKTIESVSDTIIHGKNCQKLIEVERLYQDTMSIIFHYCYSSNDSVCFYNFQADTFFLLYNFSLSAGETMSLPQYLTINGTPLLVTVDSITNIQTNNLSRRAQYVSGGDGITVDFGGIVIEGIGNINFMFPVTESNINGPLRCYADNIVGQFFNNLLFVSGWNYQNCEDIITGIIATNNNGTLEIFSNPVINNHLFIHLHASHPSMNRYQICSIDGKVISKGVLPGNTEETVINLDKFNHGLYFIIVFYGDRVTAEKFIIN
jgi:hypothetical protein